MRMRSMGLVFLISLVLITCSSSNKIIIPLNSSLSSMHCHPEDSSALLGFINSMNINYSAPNSANIRSWMKGSDCCGWDGVTCHPTSHHVIKLYLFNSGLVGTLDSNSTLFHLRHLRELELYGNDFSHSTISPMFGTSFPLLEVISLARSNFSGEVPFEISQLSKLQILNLCNDLTINMSTFHNIISNLTHLTSLIFEGVKIDSTIPPSFTNLSSLIDLDLSNCNLRGELRANVFTMPKLRTLYLNGNHDLHAHFPLSNWSTSLEWINLANVNFSSRLPPSPPIQSQYNQLQYLYLSGCSFHGQIPDWVWNTSGLERLDLSDNKFNGSINLIDIHTKFPNFNITTSLLYYLNISHNYLTGRWTSLPWKYLYILDLSFNMFHGPLIPPIIVNTFLASNNNFTGPLSSSICNLNYLTILDLANNNFKDELPVCLGNLSHTLVVLNLGSNNISGTFPDATFSDCYRLKYLDLSFNLFEGLVPRLLTRCKRLEVLNLRNNKFSDEYPHWFDTFSNNIRVLVLSNNGFFGPLPPSYASNPFHKLQVLDLSNNNFSGQIPVGYVESLRTMMNIIPSVGSLEYMRSNVNLFYYYSITLTFNGVEFKYKKIITTLVTFDLSNNKFEGEIPNNIGKLVSLHGLNLSHNQLIGQIPPSLGNLTLLDCLDLSSNKLTAQIPQELSSLSALGVFNVSENQLEGPIPNHFETFPVDSYKGNLDLCGIPLPECGEHDWPSPPPYEDVDEWLMSGWKAVMMGIGFGTFVSFAWGCYMLSIGKPLWLLKFVLILVDLLKKRLLGRRRRRPTRGRS